MCVCVCVCVCVYVCVYVCVCVCVCVLYTSVHYSVYRGKSPITDPFLIPTPYRISVTIVIYKRYLKIIYTRTISNDKYE